MHPSRADICIGAQVAVKGVEGPCSSRHRSQDHHFSTDYIGRLPCPQPTAMHPSPADTCRGAQVAVKGVEGPLQQLAQQAVLLQPGRDCSVQEVKESAAAVFGTGFFSSCATKAHDTRDGTEISIEVGPPAGPGLQGAAVSVSDMHPPGLRTLTCCFLARSLGGSASTLPAWCA